MQKIYYLKIQNFKVFGDEITIPLDNPTVLIGANNSGKTSTIQAIALWSWAIKIWFEKKKNTKSKSEQRRGVALNRLEIAQVPIKETRFFWHQTRIRQNQNDNIELVITIGLLHEGKVKEVGMIFKYHSPDLMYCQPTSFEEGLLEYAQKLKINLLYPMSGISDKEYVFQEEAIRTQIGIGQTANVLRNICYHLSTNSPKKWEDLEKLMETLFSIKIKKPFVRATGAIEVHYNYSDTSKKTDYDLDITLAGRGQQQMLLVLAYLLANENAVLMIDEPDAHLEILRQSQIFATLKDTAQKYGCQIIIVTHSEVVLNEADKVIFIADGKAQEISDRKEHKHVKDALRNFGIEHYYKAQINPHIFYVEGSSDISMLKAFAKKFQHPALSILERRLNVYYTKNESFEKSLENELKIKGGAYKSHKGHFSALKKVVPNLNALAIFDGDNKGRQDEVQENFMTLYWKRYELENYFITPKYVLAFAKKQLETFYEGLFSSEKLQKLQKIIDQKMVLPVLNDDEKAFEEFKNLPENLQNVQFQNLASSKKMSAFLEEVFEEFSKIENEPILLSKGNFYQIIDVLENIPSEVREKLDKITEYLKNE